jgi:hypothetical protein
MAKYPYANLGAPVWTYGGPDYSNYKPSYTPTSSGNLPEDTSKIGSKYYNPQTRKWGTITGYNYTDPAYLEAMAGHMGGQAGTGGASSTAPTAPPVVVDYGDQKDPLELGLGTLAKDPLEPGIGQLTGAGAVEALSKPGMSQGVMMAMLSQLMKQLFPDRQETLADIEAPGQLQQAYPELMGAVTGNLENNPLSRAMAEYRSAKPNLSADAGLDPFFDRQREKLTEEINRTMAARGRYGSSAAGDLIEEGYADLGAQQALKEADYNLARSAEQRGWEGLGITGAAAESGALQGWVNTGGALAGGVESMEMSKDIAALQAATGMNAQEIQQSVSAISSAVGVDAGEVSRWLAATQAGVSSETMKNTQQNYALDAIMQPIMAIANLANSTYGGMFEADDAYLSSILGFDIGKIREQLNMSQQDFNNFIQTVGAVASVGSAAGNLGAKPFAPSK